MFANLIGRDGIVASVSFDQSLRGARYQFERAYFQYHASKSRRAGRGAHIRNDIGIERTYFYQRCHKLGVRIGAP